MPTELIKKLYCATAIHSMTRRRLFRSVNHTMEKPSTVVTEAEGIALHFVSEDKTFRKEIAEYKENSSFPACKFCFSQKTKSTAR